MFHQTYVPAAQTVGLMHCSMSLLLLHFRPISPEDRFVAQNQENLHHNTQLYTAGIVYHHTCQCPPRGKVSAASVRGGSAIVAFTLSDLPLLFLQPLLNFPTSFVPSIGAELLSSEALTFGMEARLLKRKFNSGQNVLPLTVALAVLVWQLILSMPT